MGPSKVGVEKYHAWGGNLAILGFRLGVFGLLNPLKTHSVRGGFRDRVGNFGLFS